MPAQSVKNPLSEHPRLDPHIKSTGHSFEPKPYFANNIWASFGYAWQGLQFVYDTERNFRIHLVMASVALSMGIWLKIALVEWVVIWALIGFVLVAELSNTAMEHLVDLYTQGRYNQRAKWIKDIMAGAVMVAALVSATCGALIFLPHLL